MEADNKTEEIVNILAEISKCKVMESDDVYIFTPKRYDEISFSLDKTKLYKLLDIIKSKNNEEGTILFDDTQYEVLIKEESPSHFRRFREETFIINDKESEIVYEISSPSDYYLLWFVLKLNQEFSIKDISTSLGFFISPRIERALDSNEKLSIFDFLKLSLIRLQTLKINTKESTSFLQFKKLMNAFLFQLGYNLDVAFIPQRSTEELTRRGRLTRLRRSRVDDIDPPRRLYNEDLIHHYLSAISTDNPVVEFLSYYHVLEHFFESVFNDDLIENIRALITHPSFSYKRKRDIGNLIKSIKKSLRIRSETITFNEKEALKLCLEKFVAIPELVALLREYDVSLLEYYKSNKVPFSEGNQVDLLNLEHDQIYKNLTDRIYLTRNSLVHSKESENSRFTPFIDNTSLLKELPLMRFIAENVILHESKVI